MTNFDSYTGARLRAGELDAVGRSEPRPRLGHRRPKAVADRLLGLVSWTMWRRGGRTPGDAAPQPPIPTPGPAAGVQSLGANR